jgi:hypothetical protein
MENYIDEYYDDYDIYADKPSKIVFGDINTFYERIY